VRLINKSFGAERVINSLFTLYTKGRHTAYDYLVQL
jgi:hypothetical protein